MRISDWSSDVCSSDLHGDKGDDAGPDERDIVIIVRLRGDDGDDLAVGVALGRGDRRGHEVVIGFADMIDLGEGHAAVSLPAARRAAAAEAAAAARTATDTTPPPPPPPSPPPNNVNT